MTYLDQWRALSSRIRGLMEAGHLHAQYLAVRSRDSYGRGKRLREQGERILAALRAFRDSFHQMLPAPAVTAIDDFLARTSTLIGDTAGTPDSLQERVWAALVLLAAFETEMSFLLSDVQESIQARSERAFSHLQRSIVVDEDIRAKWVKAFDDGEVACEKLGAVHLLLHGIWAFKVDAAGARTDLVFQEPAADFAAAQRYADGLVLTEWKKAAKDGESRQRFEEARLQALRYAQGPLAATELTGYRYAVVVSRSQVEIPDDVREGGIIYRHVNVAVAPRVPSRA
ncbi:MAG: hypothetical protein HY713_09305 [candidate division NC10 bacterium]|nr:hypothetical protein [candidate division NC10 bacterium]